MSDEEFVRSHWKDIRPFGPGIDWRAGATFTSDRLEEIRQLEEEIETMQVLNMAMGYASADGLAKSRLAPCNRILTRLNRDLAALKTGMKPSTAQGR